MDEKKLHHINMFLVNLLKLSVELKCFCNYKILYLVISQIY